MSVSLRFEPHIKAYLSISLDKIIVLAPRIRNCQKSHNTVTNHNYILCVVRIFMKQTLLQNRFDPIVLLLESLVLTTHNDIPIGQPEVV